MGISEGFDDSLSVFPSHRKLDEEYKERIAALKNELRMEREQIMQQVGKQRLELEQEIEKAKTEENYIRDRLALSLKVITLLVLWSVSCWGNPSSIRGQVCTGAQPRDNRKFIPLCHDPDIAEPPWNLHFRGIQASGLLTVLISVSYFSFPLKPHWVLRAVWPG